MSADLDTLIDDIEFTTREKLDTRIRNGLQRNGIFTLAQLVQWTRRDLEDNGQGLGVISIALIELKLKELGLRLKKGI